MIGAGDRVLGWIDLFRSPDPAEDATPRTVRGCGLGLLVPTILMVSFSRWAASPSDWVELTVAPIPDDVDVLLVIFEDARGITPLSSCHSELDPSAVDPPLRSIEMPGDAPTGRLFQEALQWQPADRYGVLLHRRGGPWRTWWPGPREVWHPST